MNSPYPFLAQSITGLVIRVSGLGHRSGTYVGTVVVGDQIHEPGHRSTEWPIADFSPLQRDTKVKARLA